MSGNDHSILERPAHAPAFFLALAVAVRGLNPKHQDSRQDRKPSAFI
jgi:hypothetical protein